MYDWVIGHYLSFEPRNEIMPPHSRTPRKKGVLFLRGRIPRLMPGFTNKFLVRTRINGVRCRIVTAYGNKINENLLDERLHLGKVGQHI
jgi:hypothetical protein